MSLELTDITNFEDLTAISTIASDDILPITDISVPSDHKITIQSLNEVINVLGEGVYLSSGRKFAEEKLSEDLASGLYVIAETDTSVFQTTTGFLLITVVGSSRRGAAIIEYSFTDNNPAVKEIKYISLKNAVNVPIKGIFLAYADATSQGCKILIDVDASTTVDVKVQNLGNLSHNALSSEATGINLVTATTTDNNLTPGGSTASYLEAGTVFEGSSLITHDQRVQWNKIDNDNARITILMDDIPKQNASSVNVSYTQLIFRDGNNNTYTVTGSDTLGSPTIKGRLIIFSLTTSVASALSSISNGGNVVASQGFVATLS